MTMTIRLLQQVCIALSGYIAALSFGGLGDTLDKNSDGAPAQARESTSRDHRPIHRLTASVWAAPVSLSIPIHRDAAEHFLQRSTQYTRALSARTY